MVLPYGEEIMVVCQTMWKQSTSVTDEQTDRFTMTKTALCIASRNNNSRRQTSGVLAICHIGVGDRGHVPP